MKRILIFSLLFLALNLPIFSYFFPALAASDTSQINLQVELGTAKQVSSLADYIFLWYNIVTGSISVLAAAYIVWGGFKWLSAAGNSGVISEAKQTIIMAIIGLLIALFSYSLLYLLNPNLTKLNTNVPKISSSESTKNCTERDNCLTSCGNNESCKSNCPQC